MSYVQVNGVKYWYCESCKKENIKGERCKICGKTKREKK